MQMDILVLDDEKEITELVELYLRNEGFQVRCFYTGEAALASVKQSPPDLAILDVMLPDMDGFSVCRELRKKYTFPILMLTARVEDMDKINGLAIGADDYITKPFNPLELTARVKAQLRRYTRYNEASAPELSMDVGNLSISKETHECTLNGKRVSLTPIEFDILWLLCENRGKVISAEELFEKVWGDKFLDCNNTVMVHIRRLREKLHEPPRNPRIIKTVWGVGYKIE
ncbi:MAG: VanR-ABDEGLN family response regulator transcription factor [Hydrogeniiclostridium sp.]